jgi:outer membrane protein assembly factor BamB
VLAVAAGLGFHSVLTKDLPSASVARKSEPSSGSPAAAAPAAPGSGVSKPSPQPTDVVASDPQQPDGSSPVTQPAAEEFQRNWPRFRGALGNGISVDASMPTAWDGPSGKGVLWKSPVPLPGNSSPIVWRDAVYLTGADENQRELYCFDASQGTLRWKWTMPAGEAAPEPLEVTEDTGFAAPTPATDGIRMFVSFATGDLAAVDLSGKQVWLRSLGVPKNSYGHAASLAVTGQLLLVQFDQGARNDKLSKLLALSTASGETVWEVAREVPNSWSTPLVVEHEGQSVVITCGDPWVIAYNVTDGKEVWRSKSLRQDIGPSPVAANGLVFAANEFPGVSAIRLGGQGDVTATHVAWTADSGAPDTCSPLVVNDLLVLQASFGTLTCYSAAEGGDPLWEEEFDDNFRSSPGLAGENVYLFAESGKAWVVKATREKCEHVAENDLGEECVTSPAFVAGRLYIRGKEHLFCLGTDVAGK